MNPATGLKRPLGRLLIAGTLATAALALSSPPAEAVWNVPTGYADQLVVGGFTFPVGFAFLPDGRMLVVEKDSARVRLVIGNAIAANDPLVRVPNVRFTGFEQGLLGVAVDPGFPARPYFYVHYDYSLSPNIRVSRYTVSGDLDFTGNGELTCDPASRYDVLTDLIDVNDHHNGGTLRFGTDVFVVQTVVVESPWGPLIYPARLDSLQRLHDRSDGSLRGVKNACVYDGKMAKVIRLDLFHLLRVEAICNDMKLRIQGAPSTEQ